MAITTYAELKAAAANFLIRGDLTTRIPEFIALAEARLNRVVRKRQAETDAALTATPGSRAIALPSTFSEPLNLWIVRDGEREALNYLDPILSEASEVQGEPRYWGIDGANVAFERPCDQAYSFVLRHLAKYALSDSATTNTLLTDAPDVYLFATLCEAGPFLRDAELAGAYEAKLGRAISELNAKDGRSKSRQRLVTEVAAMTGSRGGGFDINRGF
jgi:hypothetical protein